MIRATRLSPRRSCGNGSGFTLVELMVVIALVAVLSGLALASVSKINSRANTMKCVSVLKSLGAATLLYTTENGGELPRSFHSAGSYRQPGWAASIAPYLGIEEDQLNNNWARVFNAHFRSPADPSADPFIYSYGFNVHFELDPNGDDFVGSPQTWRRLSQIPAPASTILIGQTKPVLFGDHLMCHQWSGVQAAKNALNHEIHNGKANYLFLDGHVETLRVEQTFDPSRNVNRWNPSLAPEG